MTKRAALWLLFTCTLAIALAYASAFLPSGAPHWGAWVFAIATSGLVVSVLLLGAARRGRVAHRGLLIVFALIFVILAGGFGLALTAPAITQHDKLWLGLPRGAAIILYIVGLLPIIILPLAYALTFEDPQ